MHGHRSYHVASGNAQVHRQKIAGVENDAHDEDDDEDSFHESNAMRINCKAMAIRFSLLALALRFQFKPLLRTTKAVE